MKKIVLSAVVFSLISGVSYASQKKLDNPKDFLIKYRKRQMKLRQINTLYILLEWVV